MQDAADIGKKLALFPILRVFLSFLFDFSVFLKEKVVDMRSLSSC